jgi:MYND finger
MSGESEESEESEERLDPNTLWCSPYGDSNGLNGNNYSTLSQNACSHSDKDLMALASQVNIFSIQKCAPILEKLQQRIAYIWKKHKESFLHFWSLMTLDSRKNFIMDVSPLLCYADDDRYCVLDRQKVYQGHSASGRGGENYDRLMLLVPYMNVCTLSSGGQDLVWLFEEVSKWDLAVVASGHIVNFRQMFDSRRDMEGRSQIRRSPDTFTTFDRLFDRSEEVEYKKQKNLKKGDTIVLNKPQLQGSSLSTDSGEMQFSVYVECNDPERARRGANLDGGTIVEGSGGFRMNLWNFGIVSLPYENEQAVKAIHFVLSNLAQWLDEFRVEYLGRTDHKNMLCTVGFYKCANCDNDDSEIKKLACNSCKLAFYCDKECQKAHWRVHKVVCRNKTTST